MSSTTAIEWTDATWNPVRGCSRISPGCGGPNHQGGCYAEKIAARFSGPGQPFEGFAKRTAHGGAWTGKMALVDDMLTLPLRWRKPRRIFVNSMSDLFHENLPDEAIDKVFAIMALAPQHTFQVLTKRANRMRAYCSGLAQQPERLGCHVDPRDRKTITKTLHAVPLPNVWLGVSVEDQPCADERIPDLLATPAAIRFLSCEPLLGPVELRDIEDGIDVLRRRSGARIDWIIAGGESGPGARPAHPDWFRSLRDQCTAAGVPFFFKQWGEFVTEDQSPEDITLPGSSTLPWSKGLTDAGNIRGDKTAVYRVGKKRAGALLDGREHREFPT